MSIQFDHIISLGADCLVATHLRRVGWHQTPSVFDWLVTPWEGMMGVLADDGARLSERFHPVYEGHSLACSSYNVVYMHEFPRNEKRCAVFSPQAAEQARRKLLHKMTRMRAACKGSGCVLFVRAGAATDAPSDRYASGRVFSGDELDRCCELISSLYPNLRFSLLFLDKSSNAEQAKPPADPRVSRLIEPALFNPSSGSDADVVQAWNSLFSRIPYSHGGRDQTLDEAEPNE